MRSQVIFRVSLLEMFGWSYQLISYREGKGPVAETLKSMARRNDSDLVT
jgi:hypothetical protein